MNKKDIEILKEKLGIAPACIQIPFVLAAIGAPVSLLIGCVLVVIGTPFLANRTFALIAGILGYVAIKLYRVIVREQYYTLSGIVIATGDYYAGRGFGMRLVSMDNYLHGMRAAVVEDADGELYVLHIHYNPVKNILFMLPKIPANAYVTAVTSVPGIPNAEGLRYIDTVYHMTVKKLLTEPQFAKRLMAAAVRDGRESATIEDHMDMLYADYLVHGDIDRAIDASKDIHT